MEKESMSDEYEQWIEVLLRSKPTGESWFSFCKAIYASKNRREIKGYERMASHWPDEERRWFSVRYGFNMLVADQLPILHSLYRHLDLEEKLDHIPPLWGSPKVANAFKKITIATFSGAQIENVLPFLLRLPLPKLRTIRIVAVEGGRLSLDLFMDELREIASSPWFGSLRTFDFCGTNYPREHFLPMATEEEQKSVMELLEKYRWDPIMLHTCLLLRDTTPPHLKTHILSIWSRIKPRLFKHRIKMVFIALEMFIRHEPHTLTGYALIFWAMYTLSSLKGVPFPPTMREQLGKLATKGPLPLRPFAQQLCEERDILAVDLEELYQEQLDPLFEM